MEAGEINDNIAVGFMSIGLIFVLLPVMIGKLINFLGE